MKTFAALSLLAALATAQSITDLPSCSLSCVLAGVSATGCDPTDFACSCKKADVLTPTVTPCVQKACSAADQATVISTLEGICAAAGVPITIPTPGASTSEAAPAPSSEAPAPTVETSAPVPSATDIVITSVIPSSVAPYPTGTGVGPVPSGTGVHSSGLPEFTGAAAAVNVPAGIAGVLGMVAYLL